MNTQRKSSSETPFKVRWQIERYRSISRLKILLSIVILLLTIGFQDSYGQGVGISEISISPEASAILELKSVERGFLVPRMTTAQRDDIASPIFTPATGMIVYNTTTNKLNMYNGTIWVNLFAGSLGVNSVTGTAGRIDVGIDPENPIIDIDAAYIGQTSVTTLGTVTTGTWQATVVEVNYGGTGLSSITSNNLLYGNGTGPISLLAPAATTGAILMNTTGGAPSWATLNNLPATAGVLPIENGGTNSGTVLSGSTIMISDGASIVQGEAGTTTTVLHGNPAGAPTYSQVVTADIADETILAGDIATGAVTTDEILDGTIANVDLNKTNIPLSGFGAATAAVDLGSQQINNLADPTLDQDAATKIYVDSEIDSENDLLEGNIIVGDVTDNQSAVDASGDGFMLVGDGTTINSVDITGDIDVSNTGVSDIQDNTVGSDEIINNSIDAIDINTSAVTTDEILDETILAGDIATGAVTTDEILDETITVGDIGTAAVGSDEIINNSIDAIDINTGAVTTDEILDGTIANVDLNKTNIPLSGFGAATAAVDLGSQQINNLADPTLDQDAATKIYVDSEIDGENDLLEGNIIVGDVTDNQSAVDASGDGFMLVGDGTTINSVDITGDIDVSNTGVSDIQDNTVGSDEIINNSIDAIDINTSAVTTDEILDETITVGDIGTAAVGSDEIINNSIDAIDINTGAVTTDEILDGTIANVDLNKTNIPLSGFGAATAAVDLGSQQINNLADPTLDQDAATKIYVDSEIDGENDLLEGNIIVGDVTDNQSAVDASGDGFMLVGDGTTINSVDITGDIDVSNTGVSDIQDNTVGSDEIINNSIDAIDINTSAVTTDEILDETILAGDIATGAVTTDEILDETITVGDIGTAAVGSDEIINNSIDAIDINTGAVTTDEILDGTIANVDLNKTNIPLSGFGAATAAVDLGSQQINNLADPTLDQDAATKIYVDSEIDGENDLLEGNIIVGDVTDNQSAVDASGDGFMLVGDGTTINSVDITGDIDVSNTGVSDIQDNTVGSDEIINNSIDAIDINTSAVTTDEILDETILAGDIATGAVTTDEILDETITVGDIGTAAVGSDEIINNSIDAIDINTGAVTTDEILDETILAGDIATGAVTTDEILDGTIANVDLNKTNIPLSGFGAATAAVDLGSQQINNLADPTLDQDAATKIYVDSEIDGENDLLEGNIIVGDVTDNQSAVDASGDGFMLVGDGTTINSVDITGDIDVSNTGVSDIQDNTVGSDEIINNSIDAIDINTSAVTTDEILDETILAGDIATGAVTTDEILDETITVGDIGTAAVGSDEIINNSIDAIDINTGAVTTDEILDGTIANVDLNKTNIPLSGFGAATAAVDLGSQQINNLADPTLDQDAATKIYVDSEIDSENDLLEGNIIVGDVTDNQSAVDASGDGFMLVGDGTTINSVDITGDIDVSNTGVSDIQDNTVGSNEIINNSIDAIDINTSAVTTDEILDETILAGDIATGAVTTDEILDETITVGDIGTAAVGSDEIINNSIDAIDINTGAVTTDEILDGTIANVDLNKTNIPLSGFGAATAAVDLGSQQINNLADPTLDQDAATKIYVDSEIDSENDLLEGNIIVGDVTDNQSAVDASGDGFMLVGDGTTINSVDITGDIDVSNTGVSDIQDNTVGSDEIINNSIDAIDINTSAVTTDEILDETILAGDIATGAVTTDEILDGTIANVDIANTTIDLNTKVTGTLPIANGGTGEITQQAAIDALAGGVTSGEYLRGDGTNVTMSAIQAGDVPVLNQSTTGNAATATALETARDINGVSFDGTSDITVTAAAGTLTGTTLNATVVNSSLTSVGTLTNLTVTNPIAGSVTGTAANVTGTVGIANGGTGEITQQAAIDALAGGVTSGEYLRGDGTNVTMSAIQAGDVPVLNQSTTGNAATATALETARDINGVSFDGTSDITVTAAAGTLTGTTLNATVVNSSLTSVGTLTNLTVTNPIAGSVTGTAANVTGTVGIANGGTGEITQQAAIDALAGGVTSGEYLRGDGTNVTMSAIQAGDVPVLNQSTTGNAATATALETARDINGVSFDGTSDITVTAAAGTLTGTTLNATVVNSSLTSVGTLTNLTVTNPIAGSVTGTAANVTGTVGIANGGTGEITQQAAIDALAGGVTSGEYLRGDGTNVTMSAIQAGDVPVLNQSTTGNAATATALETARDINGVSFDGTSDITVTAAAGTLTGTTLNATVVNSSLTSVGTLTNLTVTNPIAGSVTGTAANVTGTVGIANGGTGEITQQAAIDALAGGVTSGEYLRGDGTNVTMSAIQAGDVPILNQSTTGNAATATALETARDINGVSFDGTSDITVTAAAGTLTGTTLNATVVNSSLTSVGTLTNLTVTNPIAGSVTGTAANVTGTVGIANGGTGEITQQAAIDALAGGVTSGEYLRGDGTNVTMSAIQAGDVPILNQSTTGNAATATALETARDINGVSFDGTSDITVTAAAGTLTGTTLNATVVNSSLTSVGTLTNLTVTNPIAGSVTGTAANVTGTVGIANGGTGEITQQAAIDALAGGVTSGEYLRGDGTNVTMSAIQAGDVPVLNQSTTGNAATATALETARDINGVSFDGTSDITVTAAAGTLTGTTLNATVVNSSLTSVGTLTNLTVTNPIAGSVTGTAANVTGTVGIANGGTGEITQQAAIDALAGGVTSGEYLRGDGTNVTMSAIQAGDVPVLNQSTTGNAATATALETARDINGVSFDGTSDITVTAAAGTLTGTTLNATVVNSSLTSVGTLTNLTVTNPIAGSVTGTAANVTGTVGIANGGTGEITQQAAIDALAGGVTSGEYLRGDGTNVTMSAIQAGDVPVLNQSTTGNAATATTATNFSGSLVGDVTGTQGATVVSEVGGTAALNIATGAVLANSSTHLNTVSTIVRRDASGDFFANEITADLLGNATTATTAANVTTNANLSGDVTSLGNATTIANNAVTYGKMQAVSTNSRLLGSSDATTAVEEITLGAGLTMTGSTVSATASTFANPTATIGLTAVNGTATNAMRSDGAPALSQAIAPTWTGTHTWSALGAFTAGLTASGAAINLNVNSNNPTNINTGTSNGTVTVGSSSSSQTVNIGTGTAAATVNIATGNAAGDINIGDNSGTASSEVLIGGSTTINGAFNFGEDDGTNGDAYEVSLSSAPTAYVKGMIILFMPGANNTGACSLDVNGLGAKNILYQRKADVPDNPSSDWLTAGNIYILIYDGTQFLMINETS